MHKFYGNAMPFYKEALYIHWSGNFKERDRTFWNQFAMNTKEKRVSVGYRK